MNMLMREAKGIIHQLMISSNNYICLLGCYLFRGRDANRDVKF